MLSGLNGLPIRKEVLRRLVYNRLDDLKARAVALARGVSVAGKAEIQVFK